MILTKRRPVSVGDIIKEEYLEPLQITQEKLAKAMGVSRKTINEICNGKRAITIDTALLLAKVFENTPDLWLNMQRRTELWMAMNTPERKAKIDRATPVRNILT